MRWLVVPLLTPYHSPGSSGIGELLANTFAVRNVTVAVLDVNEIESENCAGTLVTPSLTPHLSEADNINYYKCDVSKWEEVERVSKQITEEVCRPSPTEHISEPPDVDRAPDHSYQQCWRRARETAP